jgi:UDP-glucose 4-epimerase
MKKSSERGQTARQVCNLLSFLILFEDIKKITPYDASTYVGYSSWHPDTYYEENIVILDYAHEWTAP